MRCCCCGGGRRRTRVHMHRTPTLANKEMDKIETKTNPIAHECISRIQHGLELSLRRHLLGVAVTGATHLVQVALLQVCVLQAAIRERTSCSWPFYNCRRKSEESRV